MKFLLVVVWSVIGGLVSAQDTLLFENFNAGWPSGWMRYNQDGLTPDASVLFVNDAWVIGEDTDSTGMMDSCAISTSWYDPMGQSDDWMVLPSITLGNNNYMAWEAKSEDPSFAEDYEIWISTTGATPGDFLTDSLYYQVLGESPFWTTQKILLDSFAMQTVNIAFRNVSDDNFLLFIDNITITENDPLSTQEINTPSISIYPNPTSDFIYLNSSSKIEHYALYSISGKFITKEQYLGNPIQIAHLEKGIYILKLSAEGTTINKRVVIQ